MMQYKTLPVQLQEKITEIIKQRGRLLEHVEEDMFHKAYLEKDGQLIVLLVNKVPFEQKEILMDVITIDELAVFVKKSKTVAVIVSMILDERD